MIAVAITHRSPYDQGWAEIRRRQARAEAARLERRARATGQRVIVIHVDAWLSGIAFALAFLAVGGLVFS